MYNASINWKSKKLNFQNKNQCLDCLWRRVNQIYSTFLVSPCNFPWFISQWLYSILFYVLYLLSGGKVMTISAGKVIFEQESAGEIGSLIIIWLMNRLDMYYSNYREQASHVWSIAMLPKHIPQLLLSTLFYTWFIGLGRRVIKDDKCMGEWWWRNYTWFHPCMMVYVQIPQSAHILRAQA